MLESDLLESAHVLSIILLLGNQRTVVWINGFSEANWNDTGRSRRCDKEKEKRF